MPGEDDLADPAGHGRGLEHAAIAALLFCVLRKLFAGRRELREQIAGITGFAPGVPGPRLVKAELLARPAFLRCD